MSKNHNPLFSDFPKVSREEWIQKATKDLKGKDVLELYNWELEPGITATPYYDQSDLEKLENYEQYQNRLSEVGSSEGIRMWKNMLELPTQDVAAANEQALKSLNNGADGVIFEISDTTDLEKAHERYPVGKGTRILQIAFFVKWIVFFLAKGQRRRYKGLR